MKRLALLLMLALAFPVAAQQKKPKKPAGKPSAHSKPTPQQIRKFNELEKKEEKQQGGIRGRSAR